MGAAQQEHPVQEGAKSDHHYHDVFQANSGVYGIYGASVAAGWTCR